VNLANPATGFKWLINNHYDIIPIVIFTLSAKLRSANVVSGILDILKALRADKKENKK